MARWFTCSPRRFQSNQVLFWRDSGLLCRALQKLGHESMVVLEGPAFEDDLPGVIRGSRQELENADWWRALKLDGLVMVGWADRQDTPVVRAIATSGTPLVLHLDSTGNFFPRRRLIETLKTIWRVEKGGHPSWWLRPIYFPRILKWTWDGLRRNSRDKYEHLKCATIVSITTPVSMEGNRELCVYYGGENHGVTLELTALPISDECKWDSSIAKRKRIVAIARWDALYQKRPYVLMDVCGAIARLHGDLEIDIFGQTIPAMERWHHSLSPDLQARIHLHGVQPGAMITRSLQCSQVYLCPSSFESGPQTVYEALACGATTVSLDCPELAAPRHAADYHHADLASIDTTQAFVDALDKALKKWERGEYHPQQISDFWCQKTHAPNVVEAMLEAVKKVTNHRTDR